MPLKRTVSLALLAAIAAAGADPPPRPVKPFVVLTGVDSKEENESFSCARSREEWRKILEKHIGCVHEHRCPSFEVDFDTHMVIALFHGKSLLNSGFAILNIADEPTQLRVRYTPRWYSAPPDLAGGVRTQSFAFVVVPRAAK